MGVLLVGSGFCCSKFVELHACAGSHGTICLIFVVEVSRSFAELWKLGKACSSVCI